MLILIGCNQPISNSKITYPLTLSSQQYIHKVIFINQKFKDFPLDTNSIELKLLESLKVNYNTKNKKALSLSITFISFKKNSQEFRTNFNVHNVLAVGAMLLTGHQSDTSAIDTNRMDVYHFTLDIKLDNQKSKLFIEINDPSNREELKKLFEKALISKIGEMF